MAVYGLPSPNSLFKKERNNQCLGDYGFQESVDLRRYCLLLLGADVPRLSNE